MSEGLAEQPPDGSSPRQAMLGGMPVDCVEQQAGQPDLDWRADWGTSDGGHSRTATGACSRAWL